MNDDKCVNCIYDHQTIHTIKLNDHQFEMLKWAVGNELNFYNTILQKCDKNEPGCAGIEIIVIWLQNLDNVLKNS